MTAPLTHICQACASQNRPCLKPKGGACPQCGFHDLEATHLLFLICRYVEADTAVRKAALTGKGIRRAKRLRRARLGLLRAVAMRFSGEVRGA